jgi:hypothetical protein
MTAYMRDHGMLPTSYWDFPREEMTNMMDLLDAYSDDDEGCIPW